MSYKVLIVDDDSIVRIGLKIRCRLAKAGS